MKSSLFFGFASLISLLWIFNNSKYVAAQTWKTRVADPKRFWVFRQCIDRNAIPMWKLLGPAHNVSFYDFINYRYNQLYSEAYPIGIFTPTSAKDVEVAVKCGVKNDLHLVPKSGGHSYAGLSIGTNSTLIVDFRYMKHISINAADKTVSVEPGTFLGHLYGTLWQNGEFGIAGGICATVAVGGLVLGGGIGYFSNFYGLAIDNIVEFDMIDATGTPVHVDPTNNSDLWWAMRGIGPGYIGILTSVKFRMFQTNRIQLTFIKIRYHTKSFQNVMENYLKWLDWVKENDPTICSTITITNDNIPLTNSYGRWMGIEVQLLQIQDFSIEAFGNPAFINVSRYIFPDFVQFEVTTPSFIDFIAENVHMPVMRPIMYKPDVQQSLESFFDYISTLTKDDAMPRYFYAKSFYVKKAFKTESLNEAAKLVSRMPSGSVAIFINSEMGTIQKPRSDDSVYNHRDALFNLKAMVETTRGAEVNKGIDWVRKFHKSVEFLDSGNTYQNYPERDAPNYLDRYYGSNLKRLKEIKKKWDPKNYFDQEQSIPID